jgi:SAM-dependent methyltransferase
MAIDETRLEQAFGAVVTDLAGAWTTRMIRLGDRLGLYRALAGAGPTTPAQLAKQTGYDERYLREWLSQQFVSGYLDHDPARDAFTLTDEYAAILADEDAPMFLTGMSQGLTSTYFDEEKVEEAFRTGAGIGWHEHHPDLYEGTRRLFRPGYLANLVQSWIPALTGVEDKLRAGGHVADIGCGFGASTIIMAQAFPQSTFVGVDYHQESIEQAKKAAADAGVADRVRFETGQASEYAGAGYDLITLFDCLHDMGDPVGALRHIRSSLAPGGSVMVVEPFAGDRLEDNVGPLGKIFYTASTLICTPSSKAQEVGLALGAQAGEKRLREVAEAAGFATFRRATETPVNLILELR